MEKCHLYNSILLILLLAQFTSSSPGGNYSGSQSIMDLEIDNRFFNRRHFSNKRGKNNPEDKGQVQSQGQDEKGICEVLKGQLSCRGLSTPDLHLMWQQMNASASISSVSISRSRLPLLDLNEFSKYPELRELSVTSSHLRIIQGSIPWHIVHLNLSLNVLQMIDNSTFNFKQFQRSELRVVDLSFNCLESLPYTLFLRDESPPLEQLYLAGNTFQLDFVWDRLWDWVNGSVTILKDADDASVSWKSSSNGESPHCLPKKNKMEIEFSKSSYSLLGCLVAKTDLEETCARTTMETSGCDCYLHGLQKDLEFGNAISHEGRQGTISISIDVDCSSLPEGRKLDVMPNVPNTTWGLNITDNEIRDLSPLKLPMYKHLKYLDATGNSIEVETLDGTHFIRNFMRLSLKNNNIKQIPSSILNAIKAVQDSEEGGEGEVYFGDNSLLCDCGTVVDTLGILNSMKIIDMKSITCQNLFTSDGKYRALKDLKFGDVCTLEETDFDHQLWIWMVVFLEALLIIAIVAKVWYDQRRFRLTGELPWCSQKMPRLPCDTILEGLKKERRISTPTAAMSSFSPIHGSMDNRHGSGASQMLLRVPKVRFMIFKTSRSNSDASHRSLSSAAAVSTNKSATTGSEAVPPESVSLLRVVSPAPAPATNTNTRD